MTEVLPRHYLIGILIFTLFIVGGVSIFSILEEGQTGFTDDDRYNRFNRSFNTLNDVTDSVGELENTVDDADTDFGTFGVLNSLINSAWQGLKLMLSSFTFMDDAFEGMEDVFGIPWWIPAIISLLVTVLILFAIYSAIFQRDI